MHNFKACLLDVKTGGGKTYMSIHAVGRIAKKANLLIITTAKQKDAKEFDRSIKSYCNYTGCQFDAMITNYDQLHAKKHKFDAYNWVKAKPRHSVVIILDEAHKAKNPTSKTSKMIEAINELPAVSRIIMATATPHTNSLLDDMTYLILAGFYKNKTQFIKRHVKYLDDHYQPVIKRRDGTIDLNLLYDPDLIIQRLANITVKIETEDILPKRYNSEKQFEFNKVVQKRYRKIQKNWREGVYDSISEAIAEQRHFVAQHSDHRLDYIKQLLTSPKRPQTPTLIFYQYLDELDVLDKYLKQEMPDYHLMYINGQRNDFDPNNLPTDPKTILICQYQAAGEGLNVPTSNFSIFFTPAHSAEKYQQARGRNRRAGQDGPVCQIRLVVNKTINEHYWHDLIDQKQAFTKEVAKKMMEYDD